MFKFSHNCTINFLSPLIFSMYAHNDEYDDDDDGDNNGNGS